VVIAKEAPAPHLKESFLSFLKGFSSPSPLAERGFEIMTCRQENQKFSTGVFLDTFSLFLREQLLSLCDRVLALR